MKLAFVETDVLTRRITRLGLEAGLHELQMRLLENPIAGAVDPGTGGMRKIRMLDPGRGKGKRGGARVHYLYLPDRQRVYLIFVYSKVESGTLNPDQKKELRAVVQGINRAVAQGGTMSKRMTDKVFDELMESGGEALEHAQGKRELRTTVLPPAPKPISGAAVKQLRKQLNVSQAVFAHYLRVSTKLVQAWEGKRRTPDGPALLLLNLAKRNASTGFGALASGEATRTVRR